MQTTTAPTAMNGNVQKRNHQLPVLGVFKTSDYSLFRFLDDNRDLNMLHVQRLVKSFEHKHLICPIIVNEKMEVIDGQHRLEASKAAGVPIFYIVVPGYSIQEVQILNVNQKNWTSTDFLHMYCERGKKPYLQLREFMEYFPDFKIRVCIRLLEGPKDNCEDLNGKMVHAKRFEEGRFVVKDLGKAYQYARKIAEFKPLFDRYSSDQFVGALLKIFNKKNYNHKEMLHKITSSSIPLKKCQTVEEYLLLLEKIYNYKRSAGDKVSFRYNN